MKINDFAITEGTTYMQAYRAARRVRKQLGRPMGRAGRNGGEELTPEEMALCREHFAKRKTPTPPAYTEAEVYAANRLLWLETYARAILDCKDDDNKWAAILATYGCICMATTSAVLQTPIDGARLGDLAVELAYENRVDARLPSGCDNVWQGFTRYLLDHGFESPGWGVI